MNKKFIFSYLSFMISIIVFSQNIVTGKVMDPNGFPVVGALVEELGGNQEISTDENGTFAIEVALGAELKITYSDYKTKYVFVNNDQITVTLEDGVQLNEVVVTGMRTAARSKTNVSLPIDIISADEILSTGQPSFDKALQYRVPSFNTVQTPVNDATSLLDPYEIRNLGPSRTLILINGKRKNLSSLLYVQTSPGRGETGSDISAIPSDAIKSVQILRDGASAQYGSGAIAGVMNVILKDDANAGSVTLRAGISDEGDGESIGISLNKGASLGQGKGFINYTVDFSKTEMMNRAGKVDAQGEADTFGADINEIKEFLKRHPDANNKNAAPENAVAKFLVNTGYDITNRSEIYFNAAYIYKKVNSFANYRTPYWRSLNGNSYLADLFPGDNPNYTNGYDGYQPTFDGVLNDYNATLGVKSDINDWIFDTSITIGGNSQEYSVNDSQNSSVVLDDFGNNLYRENSPISFNPGGAEFSHIVGNVDVSKRLSDHISLAVGSEFSTEYFTVLEGELASYDGVGSDSFAGNRPENSGAFNRYNFGGYLDVAWDVTKQFLINGTIRAENYSDFGNTFVWKANSRYNFANEKFTLRGSVSTGFRAPSLHQIYTQKSQYSFVNGSIQISGLINNVSRESRQLGVPSLDPEKSLNYTVGFGAEPFKNFNLTLDYYSIEIKDRIVLSNELDTNVGIISFFSNAIDSRTSGLDFVAGYRNLRLGGGELDINLAGNYTFVNERTDDGSQNDYVVGKLIDASQESIIFTSRPKTKWILGFNYELGKFGYNFNHTYFGKTTFKQGGLDENLRTEFIPKIVSDLAINFKATDHLSFAINVNNLFDVFPEWEFVAENAAGEALMKDAAYLQAQSNGITFNQRYPKVTYDGSHFSQFGRMYNLSINYKF